MAYRSFLLILAASAMLGAAPPQSPLVRTGMASYYGPWHQGRAMADGCRFDYRRFTAASKTLRLGTYVRVRSLRTGLSVTVRITDRGPYIKRRTLDLSLAAARAIGAERAGVVPVEIEILPVQPDLHCYGG